MNSKPGGKAPHMHDTVIPEYNPFGYAGKLQTMQFPNHLPDDHKYKAFEGQPKGMHIILIKSGFLDDNQHLVGNCELCKSKRRRRVNLVDMRPQEAEVADGNEPNDTKDEGQPTDCCMRRILELQSDFANEPCLLQKVCSNFFISIVAKSCHRSLRRQGTNVTSSPNSTLSSTQLSISGAGARLTIESKQLETSNYPSHSLPRPLTCAHCRPFGDSFVGRPDMSTFITMVPQVQSQSLQHANTRVTKGFHRER